MRTISFIAAIAILIVAPAAANPILLAPTGTTLTTGQFRAEAAFSTDNDQGKYFWLGTGILQLEANVIRFEKPDGEAQNMIGAQWAFLPETILTPGISFGVRDITDDTDDGIAGYFAITKHLPTERISPFLRDFAATAGIGIGGIAGPFLGFEAKLPAGFFVQAEYDSHDVNAAAGWQPVKLFRIKGYSIRDEFYVGAELTPVTF